MPSKNKPKDHAAALAKAEKRIAALEAEVAALKIWIGNIANRPDPMRPIGPRPGDPNPWRPRPDDPWLPKPYPARQAPGRPYIGDPDPKHRPIITLRDGESER